ncbi:MAG: DUF2141 domain-containing protein [Pseudomonadota bacterium]
MSKSFHAITAALTLLASPSLGAELIVTVAGLQSSEGRVACFLTGADGEGLLTVPAESHGTFCVFEDVWPGTYSVTAFHDLNGNRVNDAEPLGNTVEPFGTSSQNSSNAFTMSIHGACILITLNSTPAQN